MSSVRPDALSAFRRSYGKVRPPETITQEAFEGNDGHLRRLVRLESGGLADANDLWEYLQDVKYTEIQSELLAFLLPFCLDLWWQDLRGVSVSYGGFLEHFYTVLADRGILDQHLTAKQCAAVSQFMRRTILEEIDEQRGLVYVGSQARPYQWIHALSTYGVFLPDIQLLWDEWWSLNKIGSAVAAVQYISCLMYPENENPVFAPWTPDKGGGPPCLWEFAGHLYSHRWLEPNLDFLRLTLTLSNVSELLNRGIKLMVGHPESDVAEQVLADLPLLNKTVVSRCAQLSQFLGTTQQSDTEFSWTE